MAFFERLTDISSPNAITLDSIKRWLKVEHTLDDEILLNLREVAVNEAYNYTQEPFEELDIMGVLVEKPIPFNIIMACLMYIAYLYENRGEENIVMPLSCIKLLIPYKRIVGT
jgi:Phage gp6-like head-tail connector protein